ncbi:MAG: hypothetical protein ACI8RD_007453 [Bacillariaceae sp.]|jgi:hypothetical protein
MRMYSLWKALFIKKKKKKQHQIEGVKEKKNCFEGSGNIFFSLFRKYSVSYSHLPVPFGYSTKYLWIVAKKKKIERMGSGKHHEKIRISKSKRNTEQKTLISM